MDNIFNFYKSRIVDGRHLEQWSVFADKRAPDVLQHGEYAANK